MFFTLSNLPPAHEIYLEYSPGIRYYQILRILPKIPKDIPHQPYIYEMDSILRNFFDRQAKAALLENLDQLEEAILLHEQQVQDSFDNPRSYFRLCKYYASQGKPEKIRDTCNAYIKLAKELEDIGYGNEYRKHIAESFASFLENNNFPA